MVLTNAEIEFESLIKAKAESDSAFYYGSLSIFLVLTSFLNLPSYFPLLFEYLGIILVVCCLIGSSIPQYRSKSILLLLQYAAW